MNWGNDLILNDDGISVNAITPLIISASRSTDIPAFYSEWFFNRLNTGYITWKNPFNQTVQYVSLHDTRFIVFWTKNPTPILMYLTELDKRGIGYYFQVTLNDYENEGLEPNVPTLDERISTFIKLSNIIGKHRIIWRFDPLLLSNELTIDRLVLKIKNIAEKIGEYTEKFVFSFADINAYRKVTINLKKVRQKYHEFSNDEMISFTEKIIEANKSWKFVVATCAEKINLDSFGIHHNKCIDDELIVRISKSDSKLMNWLGYSSDELSLFDFDKSKIKLKDKGQRKECGCIISKDIGMYNTCNHLCLYCYANSSKELVKQNLLKHTPNSQSII